MTIAIGAVDTSDRAGIRALLLAAFDGSAEADLAERLATDGDVVVERVAVDESGVLGHILFSRLVVEGPDGGFLAVALAPLAVAASYRRRGIGADLVQGGHQALREKGEALSIVLGEPAYYRRFGYSHLRAENFQCDYQCDALQALAFGDAPTVGRLHYAPAFAAL